MKTVFGFEEAFPEPGIGLGMLIGSKWPACPVAEPTADWLNRANGAWAGKGQPVAEYAEAKV